MSDTANNFLLVQSKDFNFGSGEENALLLDCGRKLYDVKLRYETYGTLSEKKDNAVLIHHALALFTHQALFGPAVEDDPKICVVER